MANKISVFNYDVNSFTTFAEMSWILGLFLTINQRTENYPQESMTWWKYVAWFWLWLHQTVSEGGGGEIAVADIVMTVLETLQIAVNNILVWVTVKRPETGIVKEISNAYFLHHNMSRDNSQQNNQNLNHLAKDSKGPKSRLALLEEGLTPGSWCLYLFFVTENLKGKSLLQTTRCQYLSCWKVGQWRSVTSPRSKYFPWHKIILATPVRREMHNLKFQTLQQYGRGKRDATGHFFSYLFCFYRIPQNCVMIAHMTCFIEKKKKK